MGDHEVVISFRQLCSLKRGAEEMNRVAAALPSSDTRAAALRRLSAMHASQGMTAMHVAGYLGSHFLGAFSMLYLLTV